MEKKWNSEIILKATGSLVSGHLKKKGISLTFAVYIKQFILDTFHWLLHVLKIIPIFHLLNFSYVVSEEI